MHAYCLYVKLFSLLELNKTKYSSKSIKTKMKRITNRNHTKNEAENEHYEKILKYTIYLQADIYSDFISQVYKSVKN